MIAFEQHLELFSFASLYQHYLLCRRHKRNTFNALRFEARQELNLLELSAALQDRSYRPSASVCFVTERPKLREIFAADFRDRIVHHVLVHELERYWESVFIHDSYACRQDKGIHKAVDRLTQFIRSASGNGKRRAYYLQLDVRNYFMRIDKHLLWSLLKPHIDSPEVLWLCKLLVFHDCTAHYSYKGKPGLLQHMPPHKSLLQSEAGKGLPIGNLNSQFFANVYLNCLDQFVKHQLKCRYYLRYCDDFVLLDTNPEQLVVWHEQIRRFLAEKLLLALNDNRDKLRPVGNGVDFLGYIVRADYRLVRRRVVNNLRSKLLDFARLMVQQQPEYTIYRFDADLLAQCRSTLASYLGHLSHADSFDLRKSIWHDFSFLHQYFRIDSTFLALQPLYELPKQFSSARRQNHWLNKQFSGDVLLFQVGCYYEFYHPAYDGLAVSLGLKPLKKNRRGARFGVPLSWGTHLAKRLLAEGRQVLWVTERDGLSAGGVKCRRPAERWIGLAGKQSADAKST
ncbi:hypothetical protein KEF85_15645 [Methylomonas paludis]|uniref:Reverse transcriptase domain-containing protein n=1 Tax=Methylomonas paludis TaxID=1173101 RepID=A0A975MNT0_9GAMM|nr:RNA-directed DNA polymerase [Methylomonas paludis]QWF70734.1 hypothetical protein KEF85_15645 [Methylomonas paludis]